MSGPDYERSLYRPDLVPGLTTETRTDQDGRFTFSGVGHEQVVYLAVEASSVVDTVLTVMTRDVPDVPIMLENASLPAADPPQVIHGAGFTLQLKPGLTIKGLVRDRDTLAPIAGVWVARRWDPRSDAWNWKQPQITDENGRFEISGATPELTEFEKEHRDVTAFPQPGMPYLMAMGYVEPDATVVIDCYRGIPFRMKLVNEEGQPVEANVEYWPVHPNPHIAELIRPFGSTSYTIMNRAARRADGTYEGFVIPGPGAVLVKTPGRTYRPAHVEPKAFFEPGRTEWSSPIDRLAYGTHDTLSIQPGWHNQHDYSAIVLVNPAADSKPLELSATVVRDKPPRVDFIDTNGQPVAGVETSGKTYHPWDEEKFLRSSSFTLFGLHPDRVRPIRFTEKSRQLMGFLRARGDSEMHKTVRMQPGGTITGRLVGENGTPRPAGQIVVENGKPISMWWPEGEREEAPLLQMDIDGEPEGGDLHGAKLDEAGRFRFDKIIPGQPYKAKLYTGQNGKYDVVFQDVVVGPGEVRDLGDIRTKLSFDPQYVQPAAIDQQLTSDIPDDAWGKPVSGLRVAIALNSPPIDENVCLRYDVVAENVSSQDIRFAAWIHSDGYSTTELVDSAGNQVPRRKGTLDRFSGGNAARLKRYRLKPKQRMVISPCVSQLVELDEEGQPIPNPARNYFNHSFSVQPGHYSVSAAVELGPKVGVASGNGSPTQLSPADGEWTGKLQTGAVTIPLFTNANN